MQIIINPKYEPLRTWIEHLPQNFAHEGKVIHNARNQIRVTTAPNGLLINIKRYHQPSWINRIIYSYFRAPKAKRAYDNAFLLTQKGFPTPQPIAYILAGDKLLTDSYLITIQEPLKHTFYEFRNHSIEGYEHIIRNFAQLTAALHKADILHLDYSPGNILYDMDDVGNVQFSIVDVNRMQMGKTISQHSAYKNFCRLWGHSDFITLLAQEYAKARDWDQENTIHWILYYWKRFWRIKNEEDEKKVMCPIDLELPLL